MSSFLSEPEKLKIDQKLNVANPPLSYIRQQNIDRFAIALAESAISRAFVCNRMLFNSRGQNVGGNIIGAILQKLPKKTR